MLPEHCSVCGLDYLSLRLFHLNAVPETGWGSVLYCRRSTLFEKLLKTFQWIFIDEKVILVTGNKSPDWFVFKCLNCTGVNPGKWRCKKSVKRFNTVSLLGTFTYSYIIEILTMYDFPLPQSMNVDWNFSVSLYQCRIFIFISVL